MRLSRIAALAVTALLAACAPRIDEDAAFATIAADGWAYGDTLTFEPELSDSIVTGHIAVSTRHTGGYIFGNLWLEITLPPAPGDTLAEVDTVNVMLADHYGRWLGRGSGVSYVKIDTLPSEYVIERGRPVTVRHIMRVDTVSGLEQIGLVFLKDK